MRTLFKHVLEDLLSFNQDQDITTYEIERTEPTLTLREIVVGAGESEP